MGGDIIALNKREPVEARDISGTTSRLRDKITTEMDRKVCVTVLLAILATAALCKPLTELQSAQYGLQKKSAFPSEVSRRDLLASLSHEQRQLMMSQLLPQLLAEISNAEGHLHPMHDRDYAGWMDFGRRSSEDQVPDS
ncbi:gastrin/cholecystokinin-like peptide [Hyla sarda]|uniref:gastrin/cholecystokinin-like peptide n=1 Tax=Hyla sarda TaxID=327740 RepID=UPI0024C29E02|nr:gastrin/cholecystokinin-like peptide [Hyla sarda]